LSVIAGTPIVNVDANAAPPQSAGGIVMAKAAKHDDRDGARRPADTAPPMESVFQVAQDAERWSPVPVGGLIHEPAAGSVRRHAEIDDPLGGTRLPAATTATLSRRRGRGQPLPEPIAQSMEVAIGADLTAVRIHTDTEAASLARSVQARAFTQGADIYFGEGTYSPHTPSGQRLLAHELAHTVQQDSGGSGGPVIGRAADPAEAAADRVADSVMQVLGRMSTGSADPVAVHRTASPALLRKVG